MGQETSSRGRSTPAAGARNPTRTSALGSGAHRETGGVVHSIQFRTGSEGVEEKRTAADVGGSGDHGFCTKGLRLLQISSMASAKSPCEFNKGGIEAGGGSTKVNQRQQRSTRQWR